MTFWFCNVCAKTINIESKSKRYTSNFLKHEERYSILVKKNIFDNPNLEEIFSGIDDYASDCYNKYFPSFTFKCIYSNQMTNKDYLNGR